MGTCKLPMDLIVEILARLPVKSLLRFKCVCRFFYDLIKNNHQFMNKHYEFSQAKSHCAVLEFNHAGGQRPNRLHNFLFKELESDAIGCIYLNMPNEIPRFVKCCHGMLCLILSRDDFSLYDIEHKAWVVITLDVLIVNPSTREIKVLPSIKLPNKHPLIPPITYVSGIQFGFGLCNNMTGKIIMIYSLQEEYSPSSLDSPKIVMVCSQVGDSWSWRQIDAVQHTPSDLPSYIFTQDFYFKGKYYWKSLNGRLVWFDMDDEVFGKIELPSKIETYLVTVMNDTIAMISCQYLSGENKNRIEIWLMDENNNWHEQASICVSTLEYWNPIGIWNPSGHLLVLSGSRELRDDMLAPNLISIDLVTHERKVICPRQDKKSTINIVPNPAWQIQVCSERNINETHEWNGSNIRFDLGVYARVFHESLKLV